MPLDKKAHAFAGCAIAALLALYGVPVLWAFGVAVAAGAMKEVMDPLMGGHRDVWDFVATGAGAATVLPLLAINVYLSYIGS